MKKAFGGVEKMLLGKKFPMNLRALRFVVLELLRGYIENFESYNELTTFLNHTASKSCLAEHWVKNLIKPVLLMMLYVRAEREGEFGLHLFVCKEMLPYFFAAGHWNYARDGVAYLRMMEKLPHHLMNQFMEGHHIVRLQDGLWNGIWTDNAIESTYMKIGKGPSGVIGFTTNERYLNVWANSHHLCADVISQLEDLRDYKGKNNDKHKEEGPGRISSDREDKLKLRSALKQCIHPLAIEEHSNNILVNIYTGEEADKDVNVNKSVEIGLKELKSFQESLPEGFRKTLSMKVITMRSKKNGKEKDSTEKINSDLIFSRVLYLVGNKQLDFSKIFNHELAPFPTSLFKDSGEGRYPKSKSVLKNKLKFEVSSRLVTPDAVIIDGGGMLHSAVHWPKNGFVKDFVKGITSYVEKFINVCDSYLIFDRYFEGSIKSETRLQRIGGFRRSHQLTINTELPSKDICMSSTKTKENLIEIIASSLLERFTTSIAEHKLVVTSKSKFPIEILNGKKKVRQDLETLFDEADYIIPQQVNSTVLDGCKSIKVISSDTDVFVLLCSMYLMQDWSTVNVYLEDFNADTKIIDIGMTVRKHKDIVDSLIALHALSGCDSVPMMFGIGKGKALSALKKQKLSLLGQDVASIDDVILESKLFVARCYGLNEACSSANR